MRIIYLFVVLLFACIHVSAQYPAYHSTVYGSGSEGYYFVCAFGATGNSSTQMILDSAGDIVYYKRFPFDITLDFKIQPNGLISYGYFSANGKFFLMDSTFTIVDSAACKNGYITDTHDFQILANGHFLILGFRKDTMDLTSYHFFHHNGTAGSPNAIVTSAVIQELDASGNVVFEWLSKDYLPFNSVDAFWLNDATRVDWTHSNAVELDTDGNILLSSRHLNEITKINRTDSTVMWRFGGKYNQFTFIGDTLPFYGQHDIRRIGNGHVTLYDDGDHGIPHYARALEYQLDEVSKTAELKWKYIYDSAMFSYATGNVQRLQNTNTLINYGVISNQKNVHFNVVDTNGAKVFEMAFDDTLYGYRSFNYKTLPWNLNRPHITCFDSLGSSYLDAGPGYASYRWSNGSTARIIRITLADTFSVFVPYGSGGFIASEKFIVADTSSPCSPTAVFQLQVREQDLVELFPNPVYHELTIRTLNIPVLSSGLTISDATGKNVTAFTHTVARNRNSVSVDISALREGLYFLRINHKVFKFIKIQ